MKLSFGGAPPLAGCARLISVAIAAIAGGFTIITTDSQAADLYGRPAGYYPAPAPQRYARPAPRRAAQPALWQGLYIGGTGGGDFGNAHPHGLVNQDVPLRGGSASVLAGYNWQSGPLVLGLEMDAGKSWTAGSKAFNGASTVSADHNWISSLRARLGYAFGDVMVYGTGGYARGSFDVGMTSPGTINHLSQSAGGYVVGVGIEKRFTQQLSGRIEALHYGFGEQSFKFSSGAVPVDLTMNTVRAGITWRFN
jgi:outer membrane immunogenic protein